MKVLRECGSSDKFPWLAATSKLLRNEAFLLALERRIVFRDRTVVEAHAYFVP
jgi:hypothetical protein